MPWCIRLSFGPESENTAAMYVTTADRTQKTALTLANRDGGNLPALVYRLTGMLCRILLLIGS